MSDNNNTADAQFLQDRKDAENWIISPEELAIINASQSAANDPRAMEALAILYRSVENSYDNFVNEIQAYNRDDWPQIRDEAQNNDTITSMNKLLDIQDHVYVQPGAFIAACEAAAQAWGNILEQNNALFPPTLELDPKVEAILDSYKADIAEEERKQAAASRNEEALTNREPVTPEEGRDFKVVGDNGELRNPGRT